MAAIKTHYGVSLCLFWLISASALAAEGDGLYGRLDGDFAYSIAAGAGLELNEEHRGFAVADLRLRYLDSIGLVAAAEMRASDEYHLISALDLRPLFLWRFFTNRSSQERYIDLWIDSFGLEIGTVTVLSEGEAALGLVLGTGFDLPILLGKGSSGLFIRFGFRYQHGLGSEHAGSLSTFDDFTSYALLSFKDFFKLFSYRN
ncbi:MAG: hypothetical protein IPJ88_00545 [Myxococcales bacterium]|nr:MAG: hypothetical protein IPJ88_00545 [Myxococcales bacterium]